MKVLLFCRVSNKIVSYRFLGHVFVREQTYICLVIDKDVQFGQLQSRIAMPNLRRQFHFTLVR